jgi:hypothetical protein
MRSGTAIFTMPAGPIKCGGPPQKIAYLAADCWRQQSVLNAIRIILVLPSPEMFGVKVFAELQDRRGDPQASTGNKMLLAEFDYTMQPAPSIPFIDTTHERRDMWYLNRYGLPAMYWNLILAGRA